MHLCGGSCSQKFIEKGKNLKKFARILREIVVMLVI